MGPYTIHSDAEKALVDSGSSLLIMGQEEFAQIISILKSKYGAECEVKNGKYYCEGDYKKWPELNYIING